MRTAVFCAMRGFALARSRMLLMGAFREAGWRVVALAETDRTAADLEAAGLEVRNVSFFTRGRRPWAWPGLAAGLRRELATLRPDFLHVFNALPILLGGGARVPVRVATVTGLGRGYERGGLQRRLTLAGYGRGLRGAAWTVFQNEEDRLLLAAAHPWLAECSSVIVGSGADTERFLRRHGQPDGPPQVLMVTRLLWQKGVREFADLACRVHADRPEVRFRLAGELVPGDPDGVPETWITDRATEGVWEFLGYRKDMEDLLPRAAILVHPTRYREGVPRVVLEAGACGVPVVAARGPGADDVVLDGITGHLVDPSDVDALATAVTSLLDDADARSAMGIAAADHIRSHHSLQAVTARYLDLYRRLGVDLS
ncbi:MAG: glycosyltransferase family 4 protein [bacterium]|nr:glycosyltransferase family 4 protein [bacterium]